MEKAHYSEGYGAEYVVLNVKINKPVYGIFLLDVVHDERAFKAMKEYVNCSPKDDPLAKQIEIILDEAELARKEMGDMKKWEEE